MQRCNCVAQKDGRRVELDGVYCYDPKAWNRRQKRLEKQIEWENRRQFTLEIIAGIVGLAFLIFCVAVYLKTGGIR